ncbi:MAG: TlpA disulfide reductase family protein [Bacteroidia bacterium]
MSRSTSIFSLALALACLMLVGCGESAKQADEFRIQGHVTGLEGKKMSLEKLVGVSSQPISEVEVGSDGSFSVTAKGEANAIFQLRVPDGGRMLLMPEFDDVTVEADADEMEAYRPQGSPKTQAIRDFNLGQYRLYLDFVSAETRLDGVDRTKDTATWRELEAVTDKAMMAYRDYLRIFCDTVKSPALRSLAALSLTPNGNYHYLKGITDRIRGESPGSPSVAALDQALQGEADRRIGVVAPVITGNDLDGKPFDLSSLRGSHVYLQFWASYCEFSRSENAKLVQLAPEMAKRKIRVLMFSLDDHEDAWREYLKAAGLDWAIHVRGLNGTASAEVSQYLVKAIPANYLIDRDGVIRDLDIRADELPAVLSTLPEASPQP